MVFDPVAEHFVKRNTAQHRKLCREGHIADDDCVFPNPPGMVYNPVTDRYIKRNSARHRELCMKNMIPREDCIFPPDPPKRRRRSSRAQRPGSTAGAKKKPTTPSKARKANGPTVAELRARCKAKKIKGYSKWNKAQLLENCPE